MARAWPGAARRAQPGHGDGEEPADRRLGRQAPGGGEGVQAVAGQLAGCDVGPDLARLGARGEQVGDQVLELLPCPGDVLAAVQQRYGQFGVVVLVLDQCECGQDGFELLGGITGGVPGLGELAQVQRDMTFVPGHQDRFDVGKYLYSVARPMPAAAAICDIVTAARPCSRTSAAVVSKVASWTARRCSSIVSVHSFGTPQGYMVLM